MRYSLKPEAIDDNKTYQVLVSGVAVKALMEESLWSRGYLLTFDFRPDFEYANRLELLVTKHTLPDDPDVRL